MSCCETQNLAVGYGAPLLRDIALHAERGKILALIGPNGAGRVGQHQRQLARPGVGGVGRQVLPVQQHRAALRRQLPGQRF